MTAKDVPNVGLGILGRLDVIGGNWSKKGTIFNSYGVWEEVDTIRSPVDDGIADYIIADLGGTVRAWQISSPSMRMAVSKCGRTTVPLARNAPVSSLLI